MMKILRRIVIFGMFLLFSSLFPAFAFATTLITVEAVTADNIINGGEASRDINIKGSVADASKEDTVTITVRRYPELNEAYHAREVFREHFPEDKQEQALQAFDAHAYNSLARGHVPASQADEADHARGDAYVDLSH